MYRQMHRPAVHAGLPAVEKTKSKASHSGTTTSSLGRSERSLDGPAIYSAASSICSLGGEASRETPLSGSCSRCGLRPHNGHFRPGRLLRRAAFFSFESAFLHSREQKCFRKSGAPVFVTSRVPHPARLQTRGIQPLRLLSRCIAHTPLVSSICYHVLYLSLRAWKPRS